MTCGSVEKVLVLSVVCINGEGMSEVGLVPFARVALQVSREVVPAYSHRFSPQRFTQPQLLAILCLMRYEDWTFRAAEVRLAEHAEVETSGGTAKCARLQ